MEPTSTIHNTFVIERTYPASPGRVFAAFTDPAKKRRWYAEGGNHDVEAFKSEFRVGGAETSSYRFRAGGPFEGVVLSSEGVHLDIEPDQRIIIASTMALGGARISAALITFEFIPIKDSTALLFTHQGAFFEHSDGPELREAGWRQILDRLAAAL